MGDTLPHGAPEFRQISLDMLRLACRRAASAIWRAPLFGVFFAGFYVLLGWILVRISLERDKAIGWFWPRVAFPSSPLCRRRIVRGIAQVSGG